MNTTLTALDFVHLKIPNGEASWQIDIDRLNPSLAQEGWLEKLERGLVAVASRYPGDELKGLVADAFSVDFHEQGYATWIAFSGSKALRDQADQVLEKIIPRHLIRRDSIDRSLSWRPRFVVSDGQVFTFVDSMMLERISESPSDIHQSELDAWVSDPDVHDTHWTPEANSDLDATEVQQGSEEKRPKVAKRHRAARSDSTVGSVQRTIETLFKLPEGSVRLVNPDKTFLKSNQLIGSLRKRWGE
jgi:hypothetical protein